MMVNEVRQHLQNKLIPFWKNLRDDAYGGYYGWLDYDLNLDRRAVKGCILNSRILWFFSNAYLVLKDRTLLDEADHAFTFLQEKCWDADHKGVYWSVNYDGTPADTTKHTYNQAFAIYALSSYFDASENITALELALEIFDLIEEKCKDSFGYLEAFTREFRLESNDKLSENGIVAEKTMNTLLHVLEAYTELYRVSREEKVRERIVCILYTISNKVYNPRRHRQEVFFDNRYNSMLDLHSYGHDIETAWLVDRTLDILDDWQLTQKLAPITKDLTNEVYRVAYDGGSVANECESGIVNNRRVWWIQAEAVVGFLNGYQREPARDYYLDAARQVWNFIKKNLIDQRPDSEWFWEVDQTGKPYEGRPIVEPWKCPYHNGRMCFEVIKRNIGGLEIEGTILHRDKKKRCGG